VGSREEAAIKPMNTEHVLSSARDPIRLTYAAASSIGKVRPENQDSLGIYPHGNEEVVEQTGMLFIVADGMGGHSGGKEASSLAVDVLQQQYFSDVGHDPAGSLKEAFEAANVAVFKRSQEELLLRGMGTTCTVLVLRDDEVHIGHIGDSRAYQIDSQRIVQLTDDHSRVGDLLRDGQISKEEARTHPGRSMLTRALGIAPEIDVDYLQLGVRKGETCYALCTDGICGPVDDDTMRDLVWSLSPQEACDRLIQIANSEGGFDNSTIIVVRIHA
jgi:PPM family protein phosphatase